MPPNQAVVLNHEHTVYQWCTLEEAKALTPFPNQHRVFEHVWAYFVDKPIDPLFKVNIK